MSVETIAAKSVSECRFREYASLRSGRDQYTRMGLARLRQELPRNVVAQVERELADEGEKHIASTLRWVLRGLPVDHAIRRERVSIEIGDNARGARQYESDRYDLWQLKDPD